MLTFENFNNCFFSGKVEDFPKPKPFRAVPPSPPPPPSTNKNSAAATFTVANSQSRTAFPHNQTKSGDKMLLEALDPGHHHHGLCDELSLHSPASPLLSPCSSHPSSLLPSPAYTPSAHNYHTYFQFPPPPQGGGHYVDAGVAVKEEPSWSVPALELPPIGPPADATEAVRHLTTNDSYSPMLMSPAPSNLNTPRVSLSSHHSDFSARLRSCHSSLQCSPHASPLGFTWDQGGCSGGGLGGFGHSLAGLYDLNAPSNMDMSSSSPLDAGYITPPRSGYSSPLQEEEEEERAITAAYHHCAAPPSYDQSLQQQQQQQLAGCCYPYQCPESPYLPPPYPYDEMSSGPPAYTPDPESSLLSERDQEPPDTPDSSVKDEPSEDINEDGAAICR